jgi:glycosyltransferase involved in cell wall biosynthesis
MNTLHPSPLITVIIPTYNRIHYLERALRSVLEQTYQNLEVIIADDHSPENPAVMIQSLQDSRVRLRRNPQNLGNGPNVARAFQEARGEYVASLNDDDTWDPQFLERLIQPLETYPHLAIAFCDHYIMNGEGQVEPELTAENSRHWKRDRLPEGIHQPFWTIGLVDQSVSPASSALLRRTMIDWSDLMEVGVYWDYYLTYLACCKGYGAYYCPEKLTYYRIHENSETTQSGGKNAAAKIRKGLSGSFCYERFLQDPNLQEHYAYFLSKWVEAKTTLGIGLLRNGQSQDARSHLLAALSKQFTMRTLKALILSYVPRSLSDSPSGDRTPYSGERA